MPPFETPYGHVVVDVENARPHDVALHDGSHRGRSLMFRVEVETLTPMLAGHFQYNWADLKHGEQQAFLSVVQGLDFNGRSGADKRIVEPLRATWLPGQPVIIAGSALKGMLRAAFGRLTASPFERANERHHSYRPNRDMLADGGRLERRIGVVSAIQPGSDGSVARLTLELHLADRAHLVFVRDAASRDALCLATSSCGRPGVLGIVPAGTTREVHQGTREKPRAMVGTGLKGPSETLDGWTAHRYFCGVDGGKAEKSFARAFAKSRGKEYDGPHPAVLIKPDPGVKSVEVGPGALHQYNCTRRLMCDDKVGHRADHPLSKGHAAGFLPELHDGFAEIAPGDVLFVEIRAGTSDVITIGHHFHYRVAYADSVLRRLTYADGRFTPTLRPEFAPLPEEGLNFRDAGTRRVTGKLSASRRMFGYVNHIAVAGTGQPGLALGPGKAVGLAGRVRVNHGLEWDATVPASERFVGSQRKCWVALPELATPKSAAPETNLRQPSGSVALSGAAMLTYGDSWEVDASGRLQIENRSAALAGARGDLHMGSVNHEPWHFDRFECAAEEAARALKNKRASLARDVLKAGRHLGFTLEADSLDDWEIGALLAILDVARFVDFLRNKAEPVSCDLPLTREMLATYNTRSKAAFKLGGARPKGLGSVLLSLDDTSTVDGKPLDDQERTRCFDALWEYLDSAVTDRARFDERLAGWLRLRRYRDDDPVLLPLGFTQHGHLALAHAEARRRADASSPDARLPTPASRRTA